ncbi:extensin-like isoform X2 [Varroa destructor]|nr:extensin-like isoform X2 [Varroa destructor]XP_022643344.1 extensin-like isoform X2 [Varroa destructor]
MGYWCQVFVAVVLALLGTAPWVSGHGRLLHPPSRSSMWRLGFKTPRNYNDHELFCGGFTRQRNNGMRCGICGDPFDSPTPRPNEMGGKYYTGIISDKYQAGQVRTITVELTANHRGYFEFKLCPVNGNPAKETEECLKNHPIEVVGEGRRQNESPYRYYVENSNRGEFDVRLRFPKNITCSQCVFQWTYTAGNNWGMCANGTYTVGCGLQETFRGCADIKIEPDGDEFSHIPTTVPASSPISTPVPFPIPPQPTVRPIQPFRPHFQSPDRTRNYFPHRSNPVSRSTYRPLYTPPTLSWEHWNSGNAWPSTVNPGYPHGKPSTTTWFYHQWPATPSITARSQRFPVNGNWPFTPDLKTSPRPSFETHNWATNTFLYVHPSRKHVRNPSRQSTSPRPYLVPLSPRLPEQEEWPSTPDLKTSPRPFPKRRPPHRKWNPEMDDFLNDVSDTLSPSEPTTKISPHDEIHTELSHDEKIPQPSRPKWKKPLSSSPKWKKPSSSPPQWKKPSSSPPQREISSSSPPQREKSFSSPPQWEKPSSSPPQREKSSSSPPQREKSSSSPPQWEKPSSSPDLDTPLLVPPSTRKQPTLPPVVSVDVVQNAMFTTPVVTQGLVTPRRPGQVQCRGAGTFASTPGMDEWCISNCNHVPLYCPSSHCDCD